MDSTLQNSERILHIQFDEKEVLFFKYLLNRALNTLDPQKIPEFVNQLEQFIDAYLHRKLS